MGARMGLSDYAESTAATSPTYAPIEHHLGYRSVLMRVSDDFGGERPAVRARERGFRG
jgi:hypothetical protein